MRGDRRAFLGTGAAALCASLLTPGAARAASASRLFHVYRGDSRIGSQSLSVARDGADLHVSVAVDIDVRILGFSAYSYRLRSDETWRRGQLMQLASRTDDNGTRDHVTARRQGDTLRIDGSRFAGTLRGNPATTTYWTPDFLRRDVWISTQGGQPLSIRVQKGGPATVAAEGTRIPATRWLVRGDIGALDLFYDARGEWIGNEFEAKGERARIVVARRGGALTDLWSAA